MGLTRETETTFCPQCLKQGLVEDPATIFIKAIPVICSFHRLTSISATITISPLKKETPKRSS